MASIQAGHDASSSAPAGTSSQITACAAQRGSTGFSVFSNGLPTIGDSMRELVFADYFAMPFPPATQSLWLLRASFTPSCLCHSDADAPPPAIQSLPASFAPFAVGLFWVLVKNKTLRQIGAKQERK